MNTTITFDFWKKYHPKKIKKINEKENQIIPG